MSPRRTAGVLAAGMLVLAACGSAGGDREPAGFELDVLSSPESSTDPGASTSRGTLEESARLDVPSALDDPVASGLPEPLIDPDRILSGGPPPDGIPPVDEPRFDAAAEVDWLDDREPVLAVQVNGENRAYPVQIMIWHEIVNDQVAGVPVSVTFCPLCNSALAFDRRVAPTAGADVEDDLVVSFGTSGSLYNSDLLMYDRQTESLWSQLIGTAVAGVLTGVELERYPVQTVPFGTWREQNPDGLVLNRVTGEVRDYGANPYAGYDEETRLPFLFDGETDDRLPPKRRVVGVASADGSSAVAVDHALLEQEGAVPIVLGGRDLVAVRLPGAASALDSGTIAEGRQTGATAVLDPVVDGQRLTFEVDGAQLRDVETGTTWALDGTAREGPLVGAAADVLPHTDAFWFAWAAFHPATVVVAE